MLNDFDIYIIIYIYIYVCVCMFFKMESVILFISFELKGSPMSSRMISSNI